MLPSKWVASIDCALFVSFDRGYVCGDWCVHDHQYLQIVPRADRSASGRVSALPFTMITSVRFRPTDRRPPRPPGGGQSSEGGRARESSGS